MPVRSHLVSAIYCLRTLSFVSLFVPLLIVRVTFFSVLTLQIGLTADLLWWLAGVVVICVTPWLFDRGVVRFL